MSPRGRARLRAVDTEPAFGLTTEEELQLLIATRDEAEAVVKNCDRLIRPLARQWANERRQFTMPTLDQLRRELAW